VASRIDPLTAHTEPDHLAATIETGVDGTDESNRFHIPSGRDTRRRVAAAMRPVSATGRRAGSATETCGPEGNTAPETTLLSGYGVDTLRWADNVRGTGSRRGGCPVSFKGG
jgi:hypothetical protein